MSTNFIERAAARSAARSPVEKIVREHYDQITQARDQGVSFQDIYDELLAGSVGKMSLSGLKRAFAKIKAGHAGGASEQPAHLVQHPSQMLKAPEIHSASHAPTAIVDTRRKPTWGDEA